MKTKKSSLLMALAAAGVLMLALLVSSCDRYKLPVEATLAAPAWSAGSGNFTRYVAIGNSLTAGFQSNALSSRDQAYSFPNLLSKAFQIAPADFQQPLMAEPGIGSRQKLVGFSLVTGPALIYETSVNPLDPASNTNGTLARPYNNLGIPGAVLFDMLDTTDFTTKSIQRVNPFFVQILRTRAFGRSIIAQARALSPTFMTCWIGNNDVLGYATSGGNGSPTNSAIFDALYGQLMDSLRAITPNVAVANVPDVTTIPFFTTVGPSVKSLLPAGIYMRYQKGTNRGVSFDSTRLTEAKPPLILLTASTYAPLLGRAGGQGGGKYYRDMNITPPAGIDTTKPFGFHPQNPFPGTLILDADEQATATNAVNAFNNTIKTKAEAKGFIVVDMNTVLKNLTRTGLYVPGYGTFNTAYITGGAFSYDGVHPSSRGSVLMANEFIKAINAKYGATITAVDYGIAPQLQGLGKLPAEKFGIGDLGSIDFYLSLLRNIRF